jgi:hypothetical protein
MSLSQRLKQAEKERRLSAGLPAERPEAPEAPEATVELGPADDVVIDLTSGQPVSDEPTGPTGVAYDPVRNGDATSAFADHGPQLVDGSNYPCPRCGGRTQVDLIDQVHQTISLSCLACFHMFRVDS